MRRGHEDLKNEVTYEAQYISVKVQNACCVVKGADCLVLNSGPPSVVEQ